MVGVSVQAGSSSFQGLCKKALPIALARGMSKLVRQLCDTQKTFHFLVQQTVPLRAIKQHQLGAGTKVHLRAWRRHSRGQNGRPRPPGRDSLDNSNVAVYTDARKNRVLL